jgi:hypothetical protein
LRSISIRSLAAVAFAIAGLGLAPSPPAQAARVALRTVCGERQGTAGDAFLTDRSGRVTLELARQGGDQHLLDQADDRVGRDPSGETGTQVGRRYCLVAALDARGRARSIVRGYRVAPAAASRTIPRPH